ncbi:MAG: LptA/OstA family protein [Isosphaeraceae bacterium]
MFKKLLKAGTTFLLILGCYYGYVQAFGLLVDRFKSERGDDGLVFPARDSRSKRQAYELCLLSFGPDHWTVKSDKVFAYYNTEQRFWMFSLKVDSVQEENGVRYNGKRLRLDRVAIIFRTNGGKSSMTVTADSATLDLNQPIALSSKSSGDGIKVLHAHFEGDVRIRDDRGTPADPADDLNVLPLAYLDFDDGTQQITTASHVVMIDPDQKTIGDGLEIQLRAHDPGLAGSSSSSGGFAGVKYAILKKTVRVHMRDVGNSGFLPGTATASTQKTASAKVVEVTARADKAGSATAGKPGTPAEPMPLYIQSDGLMRIDIPPDQAPVAVGPPAPPAPTLIRFERNVVALHGRPDRQPNQLDCDTLRLTLIPGSPPASAKGAGADKPAGGTAVAAAGEKPAPGPAAAGPAKEDATATATATANAQGGQGIFGNLTLQKAHATGHVVWLQLRQQGTKVRCGELIHHRRMPYLADSTTFRGDRTRPVWMEKTDYEKDEEKKPADDRSTQVAANSAPRPNRQVRSVTHVVTLSATLFDQGHGLDLANVRALGPGQMESRPSMNEPVERLAKWQDELVVVNYVGDDGKLARKKVTLTGTHPYFADLAQETSLDAGREIQVWLRPQSPATSASASAPGAASPASALAFADSGTAAAPPKTAAALTSTSASPSASASPATADPVSTGLGGNLQIERLMAYKDVHLKAPNRRIEAREVLDAPFIEVDPPPPVENTTAAAPDASGPPGSDTQEATAPEQAGAGGTAIAAAPSASGTPAPGEAAKGSAPSAASGATTAAPAPLEPAMTGVADRIWARVALPRGQRLDPDTGRKRKAKPTFGPPATLTAAAGNTASPPGSAPNEAREAPKSPQAKADVREAWLTGNVALHQTKPADPQKKGSKPGKQDIFAEAVYLDNPGKGKAHARVYHRNPTETVRRPGPFPLARVATDDMTIDGEYLELDQARDMVWGVGPGTLTQWTDPALLSDKAPAPSPSDEGSGAPGAKPGVRDTGMPVVSRTGSAAPPGVRTVQGTGLRSPASATTSAAGRGVSTDRAASTGIAAAGRPADSGPPGEPAAPAKPRTRAGRPVKPKDLMTITWTKEMRFNGRSKDTLGRPAGRGDFLGLVRAEMTDSLLYCEQKMVVFTDREVPLADLGTSMPGSESDRADEPRDPEIDEESAPRKSRVNLAMLFCYGNPVAINRKVDPDLPVVLEREKIIAWDRPADPIRPKERPPVAGLLQYNRLTGQFFVPGPGMVFLYNRPEEGKKNGQPGTSPASGDPVSPPGAAGATTTGHAPARRTRTQNGDRTVVPTSAVASSDDASDAPALASRRTPDRSAAEPASPVVRRKLPDLVLTQVEFSTGMRGRVGSGQATDTRQERWSEFFGDIELIRSKVANEVVELDADQELSDDGFYLTSQMLRIVETPPPPGSPAKATARTMVKAWDSVQVNKGLEFTIVSDVGTYDSQTDVLYAYGEGGRGVTVLQQAGPGQPPTKIPARAVQYGFKSKAWHLVDSNMLRIVDHRTGVRPSNIPPPDPTAPPNKKRKQPYRVPNTNLERRGFTGF